MKALTLLVFALLTTTVNATLLIPDSRIKQLKYFEKCHLDGYMCLPNFIISQIKQQPRLKFENWLTNLDLNDSFQRKHLFEKTKDILFTEMLTIDELSDVIQILEKSIDFEKNQQTYQLLIQLKEIKDKIFYESEVNSEVDFVYIFQKKVSLSFFKKNNFLFKKINHYKISLNGFSSHRFDQKPYVLGICENSRVDEDLLVLINKSTFLIENYKLCSISTETIEVFKKTKHWVIENKENILWGALLAVGIYQFQKNYEIDFK